MTVCKIPEEDKKKFWNNLYKRLREIDNIEKEAKEYVSTTASGTAEEMEMYEHFYLAAAEPRENLIAKLKAQIEKMKCCGNCSHRRYWGNELNCKLDLDKQFECDNNNKKYWEFREE